MRPYRRPVPPRRLRQLIVEEYRRCEAQGQPRPTLDGLAKLAAPEGSATHYRLLTALRQLRAEGALPELYRSSRRRGPCPRIAEIDEAIRRDKEERAARLAAAEEAARYRPWKGGVKRL